MTSVESEGLELVRAVVLVLAVLLPVYAFVAFAIWQAASL